MLPCLVGAKRGDAAMTYSSHEFEDRLSRIERARKNAPRVGSAMRIDRDGYVVIGQMRPSINIPWFGLATMVAAFFLCKGIVVFNWGPDFYTQNTPFARSGTFIEEVVSSAMGEDAISAWVAEQLKEVF
jgi:hypothetical protein